MKTNVTMKSEDRVLFGHTIKQNTKDGGSLSISDLQSAYNFARFQYGWSEKNITNIMKGKEFLERCYHLLNERGLIKLQICSFMEMVENEGIAKVLKGLNAWRTTGRGANKSTFADPYIWVMLAMELNPLIYARVVMWLTDSLIFNRVLAGDAFKPMMEQVKKIIPNPDYSKISTAINTKVFGYHETGIRNMASQDTLLSLTDFQKFITQSIQLGVIRNEKALFQVIDMYQIPENQHSKKIV